MIGIYESNFIDFLEDRLSTKVKINNKNIITKCPWCDLQKDSSKNHLWISIEAPIFHCFRAGCEKSGFISKLLKKIEGNDITDNFVNKDLVKQKKYENNKRSFIERNTEKLNLPKIDPNRFPNKSMYLKGRLKFSDIRFENIEGLIFDIETFIQENKVKLNEKTEKLIPYLQSNFIGFLTQNQNTVIYRNIDPTSNFRYYKQLLKSSMFLDYYKIKGLNKESKTIVLSEGVFDIFPVKLFDLLDDKNIYMYASALSSNFGQLLNSIVFYEQIFKMNLIILSDRNMHPNYYRKLKKNREHIIDTCTIYYNKNGKDFNNFPVDAIKIIV